MVKSILLLFLVSCSSTTLFFVKFSPTKNGLKKAVIRLKDNLKECSENRPPWRKNIKFRIKYTTLVNKEGSTEKQYLESLPEMTPILKKCLYKEFKKIKFKESKRAKKVSVVFNLNEI